MVFGLVIPYFSIDFEIKKAIKDQPVADGFNLLYVYLRFPTWWFFGVVEVLILRELTNKIKL